MISTRTRRTLSALLIGLGALFFFLVTENSWIGAAFALLGVAVELIALWLTYSSRKSEKMK